MGVPDDGAIQGSLQVKARHPKRCAASCHYRSWLSLPAHRLDLGFVPGTYPFYKVGHAARAVVSRPDPTRVPPKMLAACLSGDGFTVAGLLVALPRPTVSLLPWGSFGGQWLCTMRPIM